MADAIKVACDFFTLPAITPCIQLQTEFRRHRMVHDWPPHVLPVSQMLYDAYQTLCGLDSHNLEDEAVIGRLCLLTTFEPYNTIHSDLDAVASILNQGPFDESSRFPPAFATARSGLNNARRIRSRNEETEEIVGRNARKKAKTDEKRHKSKIQRRAELPYTCPCRSCHGSNMRYGYQGVLRHM